MSDVRMPIETNREGEKTTKICVEDVYKMVNRVVSVMNKSYNNSSDIIESINKEYYPTSDPEHYYEGYLIKGIGVSEPCNGDKYDEQIGCDIAFMKAKLNANIKKHNLLCRIYNEYSHALDKIDLEIYKIDNLIRYDLENLRKYNPEYLKDIEEKLGL